MLERVRQFLPRRFVVADASMEPGLTDGQGLIGLGALPVRVGQIRCVEHPARPGFWLVKRVTAVDGGQMIVESDNRDVPTIDSNTFGPVPVAGSYRVVIRIPRRWM